MADIDRPTILLDADACPVKDTIYRVADRYSVPVVVVANAHMAVPNWPTLQVDRVVVGGALDAADDWIADRAQPGDVVLTADIPLAARVLENGARCLDFRGGEFDSRSIGNQLASRELNAYLRSGGEITGGPSPKSQKDQSRFASKLDNVVSMMAKPSGRIRPGGES